MTERVEFHVRGQPLDGEPLHYVASGLDHVYLLNGFTVEEDPDYGRIVTIQSEDDLLLAIGLNIICQKRRMTGAEFKFLRKQMKLRQADVAERLGVDVQTAANYEKGKTIPPASERLMRLEFLLSIVPPNVRAGVMKEIANAAMQRPSRRKRARSAPVAPNPAHGAIVKQWQEGRFDFCPA